MNQREDGAYPKLKESGEMEGETEDVSPQV